MSDKETQNKNTRGKPKRKQQHQNKKNQVKRGKPRIKQSEKKKQVKIPEEICRKFVNGNCKFGVKCRFRHEHEIKQGSKVRAVYEAENKWYAGCVVRVLAGGKYEVQFDGYDGLEICTQVEAVHSLSKPKSNPALQTDDKQKQKQKQKQKWQGETKKDESSVGSNRFEVLDFRTLEEAYPEIYNINEIEDLVLDVKAIQAGVQCPITLAYFRNPVLAEDGKFYERYAIESWIVVQLSQGTRVLSPLTSEPMGTRLQGAEEKRIQTMKFVKEYGIHLGPLPTSQNLPNAWREQAMRIGSRNAMRIAYSEMLKGKKVHIENTNEAAFENLRLEKKMKDRNEVIEAARKMEKLLVHHTRAGARETLGRMLAQAGIASLISTERLDDIWYVVGWRNKLLHYDPDYPNRVCFDSIATQTFATRFRAGYEAMANAIFVGQEERLRELEEETLRWEEEVDSDSDSLESSDDEDTEPGTVNAEQAEQAAALLQLIQSDSQLVVLFRNPVVQQAWKEALPGFPNSIMGLSHHRNPAVAKFGKTFVMKLQEMQGDGGRGNEDQIGLHTDQKCANGHGLIRFKTPRDGFGCDLCSQSIPIDTVMYGCNECNYDICVSCEENTLGERKQDDAVAEFGKTLDMKLQEKYVEEENDNINSYGSNGIIEGERYRLTGLKSDGYNGKIGQCGKWHSTQKRYRFLIEGKKGRKTILVKPVNMEKI